MNRLFLLCAAVLLCTACITSGDLQRITDQVAEMELVLEDPLSTGEDIETALRETREEIASVAEDVEERTEGTVDSLKEVGGISGLMAGLAAVGLNLYRNHNRRVRGEPVQASDPPKTA